MSLIGYARVSTIGQSLDIQLEQLRAAGADRVFAEKESGSTTDGRTELKRCLDYVRDGDVLIVTRLDRLARSIVDLRQIVDTLSAKSVGFRVLQQGGIDTTTSSGRLMLNLLGSFAEFELDIRKERQMEGIAKAKARGVYNRDIGRPTKTTRADIAALRDQGKTARQIAKALGVGLKTVYRHGEGLFDAPSGMKVVPAPVVTRAPVAPPPPPAPTVTMVNEEIEEPDDLIAQINSGYEVVL